mmetsp:Transcript_27219/g.51450  ORF Transcript_27219/g.51450 Transcript_27219/m.51450 type:complete len:97 (-) Transcript_27219:202-492(-)
MVPTKCLHPGFPGTCLSSGATTAITPEESALPIRVISLMTLPADAMVFIFSYSAELPVEIESVAFWYQWVDSVRDGFLVELGLLGNAVVGRARRLW